MYMVISKPKRMLVADGVVHIVLLLYVIKITYRVALVCIIII